MSSSQMFSSKDTCRIVGISYRQLDYWATKGLFVPTEQASGSGSRRKYSYSDLVKLRVIKKMLDGGMKLEEIRRATDFLIAQGVDVESADLVMTKDSVFLHDSNNPEGLVDLIKTGRLHNRCFNAGQPRRNFVNSKGPSICRRTRVR